MVQVFIVVSREGDLAILSREARRGGRRLGTDHYDRKRGRKPRPAVPLSLPPQRTKFLLSRRLRLSLVRWAKGQPCPVT